MKGGALASVVMVAFAAMFVGLAFGLVYFRALRHTVDLLANGCGWFKPAGLTLVRIGGALILLTFMARLGAMPLLAGFLGFLLARMLALLSARRIG